MPIDVTNGLEYIDHDGHRRYLAALPYPESRCMAFPKFTDRFQDVPESDYRDFTLDDWVLGVKDQDGQGSCVGHGSTTAFEIDRNIQGMGTTVLSAECVYGQVNGGRDQGASVPDALDKLRDVGTVTENSVGPLHWQPRTWPSDWKTEAARFRIENGYLINSFRGIISAVLQSRPVSIGIQCGRNFNPDSNGVLPRQSGGGGGHCLCVHGLKKINGQWYLHGVNSWGRRWGFNGRFFIPESYFENERGHWAIVAAQDDPNDPNKPPVAA